MAVLGRLLISSAERLDLPDLLSIDSYTAGDFQYLIQTFVGASTPYIISGFDVVNPAAAIGTSACAVNIANSSMYYPGSGAGSFYYGLPTGNPNAQPLVPTLIPNATNYVYLTLTTMNTAEDTRAFWDPDANGQVGAEFSEEVNTESVIEAQINVSTSAFPENTVPVAIIIMGPTVITSITDARPLMFRLGTGGQSPNPYNTFAWPALPNASYEQVETPITITSGSGLNPFQGADKNILTLKQWMDAVMTKLEQLGGSTFWYDDISTFSLTGLFTDIAGTTLQSTGSWTHSATTPGLVSWNANIYINILSDPRQYVLEGPGSFQLQNGQVAYLDLNRNQPVNSFNSPVAFVNGQTYINSIGGVIGLFANLSIGDWVESASDPAQNFVQVVQFYDSINGGGAVTTAANAQSITISAPYQGTTANSVAVFDQGVYTPSEVIIANRNEAILGDAGGNFFWLAFRSDNIQPIEGAYAFFSGTISGTSTAVVITANNPGVVGNSVNLVFSGTNTITAAIATWNAANPSNPVTLTSGNGSQTPTTQTVTLTGGVEGSIVATDLNITISTNTVTQALVTSTVASNLAANDWITITGTSSVWDNGGGGPGGAYQILEVLTPTTFYITPPSGTAPVPVSGIASYATVTTSQPNGFPTDSVVHISGTTNYGGAPTASGTLTLVSGTGDATITFSSFTNSGSTYTFTVTSANATIDATYSNNGNTFIVQDTIVGGTTLITTGVGLPYPINVIDATHFNIPVAPGAVSPPPGGSPPLATSATYGILGATTVTNSGSTVVNGNLGLYPGTSVTGFPPGTVTGTQNIANAAANQAQIDATAAYTYGQAQTATTIPAILDGQTLTPGVYTEASGAFNLAASGTGTLTLNGAGVYIFKCSSTLTTGAGGVPIINLTNGALAQNVYWIVTSSATINSGSIGTFQGTIIANISVTDTLGGTVNGRLMALTGAVALSAATTINVPVSAQSTPTEISGVATLAAVIVRTQSGAFTLYQGQSIPIDGTFVQDIPSFVDQTPNYALPPGYNTLAGTANFNGSPTDTISVRLSELTGMMADKAQDKTVKYLPTGLVLVSNATSPGGSGTNLTGQNLGSVGNLAPGLYYFSSSAALTGTLTLDAGGDPNAQWFFQIGSTLTTASNSTVSIINGGTAGNVFWQVGSSATIGTSTTFAGNIYAQASITVNTGASVDGRLIALTGAVTLDDNAVTLAPVSPSIIATQMASTVNYAVIASSTITNTGGTVVIGDLALSPGTSVTGFPPGTVSGTQNIANGAAAQAQTDAQATYTYLKDLTGSVGEYQYVTFNAGATLTILQPGSPGNAVITLPSSTPGIQLGVNQSAYVIINRNAATTPTIMIANTSAVPITTPNGENIFVIAERLNGTDIYLWDGRDFALGTTPYNGAGTGITQVNLYDPVDTSLPTGTITVDGVSVTAGMLVLFSNLGSGNNEVYQANGTGTTITGWTAQYTFNGEQAPATGNLVIITQGTAFANQIGEFNGTTWVFNNVVRYFGLGNDVTNYFEQSGLMTTTLTDNTTNGTLFSVAYIGSQNIIVDYSILRGASPEEKETGTLYITTNGTTVSISEGGADLNGPTGVSFSGIISGSNLVVRYTTTSTGSSATMKYSTKRWSDSAGGPSGPPSYSSSSGIVVESLNGETGAVTLVAGANVTITPSGNNITIAATGSSLTTYSVADNQPTPITLFSYTASTALYSVFQYSVLKGGSYRVGQMLVSTDGSSIASLNDVFTETGTSGVTFSATYSGGNVNIQYTSTSTGSAGTFKYYVTSWS
jgi:hypothetical protein